MMPHQKFNWCLNNVFKRLYKLFFQDVFQKEIRYTLGYYTIVSIYIVSLSGLCYTIATKDLSTVVVALTMFLAVSEVVFVLNIFPS